MLKFNNKIEPDKIEKREYHSKDLERINKNNEWIKAFYKNGLDDHHKAVDLMDEVLTWRQKFGANGKPHNRRHC